MLYQYLCRMRPPAPGAIPKRNLYQVLSGHISIEGHGHAWGLVEYTEPLTDEEIEMYELQFVGTADKEE